VFEMWLCEHSTTCSLPPMSDIKPAPTVIDTESSIEIPIPVDDVESPTSKPEYASETLYIQNLNEKIRIDGSSLETFSVHVLTAFSVLKASLRGLFKSYGEVLDVVAHNNLRMRGQAFVSFESADVAKKALKEVKGFPLYSKPMVRTLSRVFIRGLALKHAFPANLVCKNSLRRGCETARRGTLRGT
jgi:U2 small nuclear ribonucleoprotein B''